MFSPRPAQLEVRADAIVLTQESARRTEACTPPAEVGPVPQPGAAPEQHEHKRLGGNDFEKKLPRKMPWRIPRVMKRLEIPPS